MAAGVQASSVINYKIDPNSPKHIRRMNAVVAVSNDLHDELYREVDHVSFQT